VSPKLTLTEFLAARIAEDEETARMVHTPYRLYVDTDGCISEPVRLDWPDGGAGQYQQWEPGEDRLPNHHNTWALMYDPARVLARCEADRRIVELHGRTGLDQVCKSCAEVYADGRMYAVEYPCDTLRLLALRYADHPDYQEALKP